MPLAAQSDTGCACQAPELITVHPIGRATYLPIRAQGSSTERRARTTLGTMCDRAHIGTYAFVVFHTQIAGSVLPAL